MLSVQYLSKCFKGLEDEDGKRRQQITLFFSDTEQGFSN